MFSGEFLVGILKFQFKNIASRYRINLKIIKNFKIKLAEIFLEI